MMNENDVKKLTNQFDINNNGGYGVVVGGDGDDVLVDVDRIVV